MRAGWGLEDKTHLDPSAVSSLWHWLHNCMHVIKMWCTQHTCVNRLYHNTGKMKYGQLHSTHAFKLYQYKMLLLFKLDERYSGSLLMFSLIPVSNPSDGTQDFVCTMYVVYCWASLLASLLHINPQLSKNKKEFLEDGEGKRGCLLCLLLPFFS